MSVSSSIFAIILVLVSATGNPCSLIPLLTGDLGGDDVERCIFLPHLMNGAYNFIKYIITPPVSTRISFACIWPFTDKG